MSFQFEVTPPVAFPSAGPVDPQTPETVDVLQQILEVQREQLVHLRTFAAAHDLERAGVLS